MCSLVQFFFHLQTNLKLYHWTTTSYARHKAADDLVDSVTSLADMFMEVYIGKYGRPVFRKCLSNIVLTQITDDTVVAFLNTAIAFLTTDVKKLLNKDADLDLLNIRDEMLGALNRTKYLFTLQ